MNNQTLEPSEVAAEATGHSLPAPLFPGHGKVSRKILVEIEWSYWST